MTAEEIRAAVDAKLVSLRLIVDMKYVGETIRTDAEKPWPCDQWLVTIDHREPSHHTTHFTKDAWRESYYTGLGLRKKGRVFNTAVKPTAADVLHAFVSDAEACDQSFSDWCSNFGYDTDSIKALNTYQACERIGHALHKLFPREALVELRELLSEY